MSSGAEEIMVMLQRISNDLRSVRDSQESTTRAVEVLRSDVDSLKGRTQNFPATPNPNRINTQTSFPPALACNSLPSIPAISQHHSPAAVGIAQHASSSQYAFTANSINLSGQFNPQPAPPPLPPLPTQNEQTFVRPFNAQQAAAEYRTGPAATVVGTSIQGGQHVFTKPLSQLAKTAPTKPPRIDYVFFGTTKELIYIPTRAILDWNGPLQGVNFDCLMDLLTKQRCVFDPSLPRNTSSATDVQNHLTIAYLKRGHDLTKHGYIWAERSRHDHKLLVTAHQTELTSIQLHNKFVKKDHAFIVCDGEGDPGFMEDLATRIIEAKRITRRRRGKKGRDRYDDDDDEEDEDEEAQAITCADCQQIWANQELYERHRGQCSKRPVNMSEGRMLDLHPPVFAIPEPSSPSPPLFTIPERSSPVTEEMHAPRFQLIPSDPAVEQTLESAHVLNTPSRTQTALENLRAALASSERPSRPSVSPLASRRRAGVNEPPISLGSSTNRRAATSRYPTRSGNAPRPRTPRGNAPQLPVPAIQSPRTPPRRRRSRPARRSPLRDAVGPETPREPAGTSARSGRVRFNSSRVTGNN